MPVDLDARNTYYGLYVTDTFDLTRVLALTAGGRLNVAKIRMTDLTGASPDLNNDLTYMRLNPLVGLALRGAAGADRLWGLFGIEPRADTARARLRQSVAAVPDREHRFRSTAARR